MNAAQPSNPFLALRPFIDAEIATQLTPLEGIQILDAGYLTQQYYPKIDVGLPLLIQPIDTTQLISELQSCLLNAYPPTHEVSFKKMTALQEAATLCPLDELIEQNIAQPTAIYVPPLPKGSSFSHLQEIIAHLRSPEGCPWDRKQTLLTMRSDLLDECTEVLDAIDREAGVGSKVGDTAEAGKATSVDNSAHIAEELGDLLMAIILMVQIATEEGRFQMADVTSGIVNKLIRRHPHVFDNLAVDGIDGINANWERIKAEEKAEKGEVIGGPLDGVPSALPALEKARQIQSKAAKAGLLDRETLAQSQPSLTELLGENPDEEAVGALLWQMVAMSHQAGIKAEDALRSYAVRFRQEFNKKRE